MKLLRRVLRRAGFDVVRCPYWNEFAHRRAILLESHSIDLVLDIGANTGQYGNEIREHGYNGRLISFEPSTAAFEQLKTRAAMDTAWEVMNLALGREPGIGDLRVAASSAASSLRMPLATQLEVAPTSKTVGVESVEVARLDDVVNDLDETRTYVKVDVQGSERDVIDGAARTLARAVGLEIELSLTNLYQNDMLLDESLARVSEYGLDLVGLNPGLVDQESGRLLQCDGIFIRLEGR